MPISVVRVVAEADKGTPWGTAVLDCFRLSLDRLCNVQLQHNGMVYDVIYNDFVSLMSEVEKTKRPYSSG